METIRPAIETYDDPIQFLSDMLTFRKSSDDGFSITKATKTLRRVSPTLVSLILQKKRSLTLDRVDEFAKLLALTVAERHYFREWLEQTSKPANERHEVQRKAVLAIEKKSRKDVSVHILKDWLNVYVKDLFQFPEVQNDPSLTEKILAHVASPKRVRGSIQFLLREGYLRTTLEGRIVLETDLAVADPRVPSQKIRQFHKAALEIAQKAIDRVPPTHRLANSLVVPLNETTYGELLELIEDFSEKLKDFASKQNDQTGDTLYQLVINASPVGGKIR